LRHFHQPRLGTALGLADRDLATGTLAQRRLQQFDVFDRMADQDLRWRRLFEIMLTEETLQQLAGFGARDAAGNGCCAPG
jgi:hypothetical protein